MGTSGCVVVVTFLIFWSLRAGPGIKLCKARNLAALALALLISFYLYTSTVFLNLNSQLTKSVTDTHAYSIPKLSP